MNFHGARLSRTVGLTKVGTGTLLALLVVGQCAGPASAVGARTSWGAVHQLGGVSTVTVGVPSSAAPTMSCWSAGNCVAVGTYLDHINRSRVFVQDEVNGKWMSTASVTGADAQFGGAVVSAVSCGGPGDCVGVGGIGGASFVVQEVSGSWQPMLSIPGLGTSISSQLLVVDCVAPGSCTAAGEYESSSGVEETFTTRQTGSSWSTFKLMNGSAALGVSPQGAFAGTTPDAISCSDAGDCAVGGYLYDDNNDTAGFIYGETGGVWAPATRVTSTVPSGANFQFSGVVSTVSCPAPGSCVAGGYYPDASGVQQAFLAAQSGSAWSEEEVPGTAALNVTGGIGFAGGLLLGAALTSISCASAGDCTGVGYYADATAVEQGFIANESSGTWSDATPLPGLAALNAGASHYNSGAIPSTVSCPSAGDCSIVGNYTDAKGLLQYFTASEVSGTPDDAVMLPGSSTLPERESGPYAPSALSDLWCGSGADCLVVGQVPVYFLPSTTPIAFTSVKTAGAWQAAALYTATATVTVGTAAIVTATRCPAPGECVAIGEYVTATGETLNFVDQEVHGVWRPDTELTSLASLGKVDAYVDFLSCPAVRTCVIGGVYYRASGNAHSFYDAEVGGIWRPAVTIGGLKVHASSNYNNIGVQLTGLACTGVASCVGIGAYQATATATKPFLLTEKAGKWSTRPTLPGLSALHARSASLSVLTCVATGYCLAGGNYTDKNGRDQSLTIGEAKGIWAPAATVAGTVSLNVGPSRDGGSYVSTAACATSENCIVTGEYANKGGNDVPYLASERSGRWAHAVTLPDIGGLLGKVGGSSVWQISFTAAACPSPASCVVVGVVPVYLTAITKTTSIYDYTQESFSILETNGTYSKLRKIAARRPNAASVSAFVAVGLACDSSSQCVAAGAVSTIEPVKANGQFQFEQLNGVSSPSESAGAWGVVTVIRGLSSTSTFGALTCRSGAGCAVGGNELSDAGEVPFVVATT